MSSKARSVFTSQFFLWIVAIVIGSYILFSVDRKVLSEKMVDGKELSFYQRFYRALKIPGMNLGIDLQGGAHLVVSVDVEKAISNRLTSEDKMIDRLFKTKEFTQLPEKKEVVGQVLQMTFKNEGDASAAAQLLKKEAPQLALSRSGINLNVTIPAQEAQRIRVQSVDQAVNILKRRLDTAGVQGLMVQQHGEHQIVIQLPGEADVDEKKELIAKTAHLEFKIVEKEASSKESLLDQYDGELPSGKEIVLSQGKHGEVRYYLVPSFPDLTGEHIVFAKEDFGEYGNLEVHFTLDAEGTKDFAELTENNVGKSIGIIIDGVMYSAPRVQGAIPNGHGRITGEYSTEEARALAIVLNSGALKAPIKFEYETRVGASLGHDSIQKGIISCLVGLLLLLIFAVAYYKLAGFFAFLALVLNLFLVLFFLSWFKFALTLSGMAGLVLTVGMAIDASILVYEQAREMLAAGVTPRKALVDGFKGAFAVIFDSNITTLLTGVVLFVYGGPAVRGFAVTLIAGIIATMLATLLFLKSLFLFVLDTTNIKCLGLD